MIYVLLTAIGSEKMLQGKVIINFEYDEKKEKCSWDLKQEGKDTLDKDDLILLFQHIIGEFMSE
jgi:hypothetical protein